MTPNPALGVLLHWLGGLASASFYVPYRWVRRWSWETFWLTGGMFSWIIAPWVLGWLNTRDLTQVLGTLSGRIILFGVFVCLSGIAAAGLAGVSKERVMSPEQRKAVIQEFDLRKGIAVATLSGVMSACFALGLNWGDPIRNLTLAHGTPAIWQGSCTLTVRGAWKKAP